MLAGAVACQYARALTQPKSARRSAILLLRAFSFRLWMADITRFRRIFLFVGFFCAVPAKTESGNPRFPALPMQPNTSHREGKPHVVQPETIGNGCPAEDNPKQPHAPFPSHHQNKCHPIYIITS